MVPLTITSLFVAIFSVALVALSIPITVRRIKTGEAIGAAVDPMLNRLVRAQGNFIEYVPLTLLGLALVEANAQSSSALWAIGGTLAAGRFLHAAGMLSGSTPMRGIGMILTYAALLIVAFFLTVGRY